MQNPVSNIRPVVSLITAAVSPDVQRAAITKYFMEDAGLRHPLCSVAPGPMSREDILGVYQWYRILSPHVDIDVTHVVHDKARSMLILNITQLFHLRFSPFRPIPSHLVVQLTLKKKNGLHYIALQEDFYQPDEFLNLLFPPIVPVSRFLLSTAAYASAILAKSAQVLGFWRIDGELATADHISSEDSQDSEDTKNGTPSDISQHSEGAHYKRE